MNKKYMLFIDAETDGLYGMTLSAACVVLDRKGKEVDRFYGRIEIEQRDIKNLWVKENVYDYLGDGTSYPTEEELLEAFWQFYCRYNDSYCIADVPYPVEMALFYKCVMKDKVERSFSAPYPLMDISSMLYAKGIDPLKERKELAGEGNYILHNALSDAYMTVAVWKKYIRR